MSTIPLAQEPLATVALSALFEQQDAALGEVREALLAFGRRIDALSAHLCSCDHTDCNLSSPERFPVEQLMSAILLEWEPAIFPHQEAADPSGEHAEAVRKALLVFGARFKLFCDCNDPACERTRSADSLTTRNLLDFLWDAWTERCGFFTRMPETEQIEMNVAFKRRNLLLVYLLTERILRTPGHRWSEAIAVYRQARRTVLYREAEHLVKHTRLYWMKNVDADPIVMRFLELVFSLPAHHQMGGEDGRDLILLLGDALNGVLVLDIAHPQMCAALYEPTEAVVPINELRSWFSIGKPSTAG